MLQSLGQHFKEGGWGMWPIVFWAVFVIAITVERSMYLFKSSINKDAFLSNIQKCILAGDVGRAIKLCSSAQAPLARIVKSGLMKVNRPDAEVQAAMDESALRELPKIEHRTAYLSLLSNLAMLSGLLGTITGLIAAFGAVGGHGGEGGPTIDPARKAELLAGGISEAMNCTAFGLIIAILGLIAFALLNGKTQQIVDDINESTVQVLNLVVNNRSKINVGSGQQAA
ncbi:MAG: MotA/TolQ/ExbB proton channel family protein [Deltaproteobacteria bacterium]|nr:MotA/TolQ/ExbB proton channel family protein [Myxococcales bacterium]MDP3213895.1 MotA/TolQ/ExbB proton channel family protein [Deltaproteobacteria bacterium]